MEETLSLRANNPSGDIFMFICKYNPRGLCAPVCGNYMYKTNIF